jgi:hypothetical protein
MNFQFVSDSFSELNPRIVKNFWEYHAANPHVWDLLVKYAKQIKSAGLRRYGVGAIFERIRWHLNVETKGDEFKLNNNYRSCYARLLVLRHPEFKDFFSTRITPGYKQ